MNKLHNKLITSHNDHVHHPENLPLPHQTTDPSCSYPPSSATSFSIYTHQNDSRPSAPLLIPLTHRLTCRPLSSIHRNQTFRLRRKFLHHYQTNRSATHLQKLAPRRNARLFCPRQRNPAHVRRTRRLTLRRKRPPRGTATHRVAPNPPRLQARQKLCSNVPTYSTRLTFLSQYST